MNYQKVSDIIHRGYFNNAVVVMTKPYVKHPQYKLMKQIMKPEGGIALPITLTVLLEGYRVTEKDKPRRTIARILGSGVALLSREDGTELASSQMEDYIYQLEDFETVSYEDLLRSLNGICIAVTKEFMSALERPTLRKRKPTTNTSA